MNDIDKFCPCCEQGELFNKKKTRKATYLGVKGEILMYYSVCSYCGTEQACMSQVEVNADNLICFHRTVERFVFNK